MIRRVAGFSGKTYNEEEIEKLSKHLNINSFRNNPMINRDTGLLKKGFSFIRKGKSSGRKDYFTNEKLFEILKIKIIREKFISVRGSPLMPNTSCRMQI